MALLNLTNLAVKKLEPDIVRREYRDQKIKGLLVRVQPSGKKTFMLNYARGKYITLGDAGEIKVARAREKALEELGKIAAGKDLREVRILEKGGFFSDFFRKYYEAHIQENQRGAKQAVVRYRHLCKEVGEVLLSDFSSLRVEEFRSRRKKEGVKDSTINRDVSAIQTMLEYAVKMGVLEEHPFKGRIKKYREFQDTPRQLTPGEKSRLRDALKARDEGAREKRKSLNLWRKEKNLPALSETGHYSDYLTPLVLTAMLTGLRRGELFNLRWQDIDLIDKTLQVRAAGSRPDRIRTVPLNVECREILFEWKQLSGHNQPADYVFSDDKGERLENIHTAFKNLLKGAGINGFRFQDLRHNYASMLVKEGIQLYTVKELLGHSDLKMTQRYAHLAPDNLQDAAKALDNIRSREVEQARKEQFERRWYKPDQLS